jgi:transcriptional regulator with XRE-family HTH domain
MFCFQFCLMHKVRNEEVMQLFGKNVHEIRKQRGFTQEYLAEEANISQVQVARIESGKLNTSISTVASLARALNVDPGEFFKK